MFEKTKQIISIENDDKKPFNMSSADICNADSAECERLLSNNVVQAQIYGSKDPVGFCTNFIAHSAEQFFISGQQARVSAANHHFWRLCH